jgi:predicted alpha-1,6-mannanase (GH76 family)
MLSNGMTSYKPSLLWLSLACLLQTASSAFAVSSADIAAAFGAYHSAFYYQNGTNAWIKDTQTGGKEYFWGQAEEIECYLDAYEWTTNSSGPSTITNLLNGFLYNNGSSWSGNMYNDDIMWAVIVFARGGMLTGRTNYCNIAKANFDTCYARAWDSVLGGGLYWTTDRNCKNACVNGPGSIAASLLYRIYNDSSYWTKASNIYFWERAVLLNTNNGAVYDSIGTNGVYNYWASSYNQGTFIGAAHFLDLTNDAMLAAQFSMQSLCSGSVLPEYGIAGNNSGFNAIFLRWMTRFMKNRNLQSLYEPWLQTNAAIAWSQRRTNDSLSWCQWWHPTQAGTNLDSWDCISSFEALQVADANQTTPAQPVPTDLIGYWPLNQTSGTNATDLSGNTNTGTIVNGTWSTSGRFGACLQFNGSSSYVQVVRPLANDFSISFWVKTTQTAGTGQWYNGVGLIDGDASGTANDFGTAMCGGKFAFGVGNPDVTVQSSVTINNGVWRHCVATRQQATGAIKVYVDGVLQGSGTGTLNTLNASSRLLFGAIASGNGYFNGSLDDVRFFTHALTAGEVAGLYNSCTLAPGAPPTDLKASPASAQVNLTWSPSSATTSYNIKRSQISGGPYVTLTNVSSTSFADATATNNRTAYYVISAVNLVGESTNSAEVSATPIGLSAWYKADALTGLTNGAPVKLWPDLTPNGFNALQLAVSNQPTYVTGALNGQPVVRFNGTKNSYLWLFRPVQDDFTIILVVKASAGVGTGTDFWSGAGLLSGEMSGTVNDFGVSLNASGQILAGTGNPDTTIRSGTGYANGTAHVVSFRRLKSTGSLILYIDGNLVASGTGGTQSLTAPNFLALGSHGTLNNFLTGDIAEVQIYNSALSPTDRAAQETALKCKYGLSGGTTLSAPTSLAATANNLRVYLTWALNPAASGCTLYRSTDLGSTYQVLAGSLTNSSYLDTTAPAGQLNYYKLASTDTCGTGAYSAAVAVLLPLPSLTMNVGSGSLSLSWPAWATNWSLLTATNLTPPVNWTVVTNTATSNNSLYSVALPIGADSRFYRLSSQ